MASIVSPVKKKQFFNILFFVTLYVLLKFKNILILGGRIYDGIRITDWGNITNILLTTGAVVAGAILAFSMEVIEFLVVTYTSSLTLSISGIFKVK